MLHMVVPVLAVFGWALFGPRPRVTGREIAIAVCWPFAWLAWTLVVGAATGWFPYPFLDFEIGGLGLGAGRLRRDHGARSSRSFALVHYLDRRLSPFPPARETVSGRGPG